MKVAIVGSRDFPKLRWVQSYIENQLTLEDEVISGAARGVDKAARIAALGAGIRITEFPADWTRLGKSAGYARNREIVAACDRLVAFWDGESRGTKSSIELAIQAGKPILICYPDGRLETTLAPPKGQTEETRHEKETNHRNVDQEV